MPTYANGKICYIELPAADIAQSSSFYANVAAWEMRTRGDGSLAFTDTANEVSGTFVKGRAPSKGGLIVYIMVDDIDASCAKVLANGGAITVPVDRSARECFAHFTDPAGNELGFYQAGGNVTT